MTIDLASLGWDDDRSTQFARFRGRSHRPGRAASMDHGVGTVLTADGPVRASVGGGLLSAAAADRTLLPCAGDWLVLRTWPDRRTTIEAVLPRSTAVILAGRDHLADRDRFADRDLFVDRGQLTERGFQMGRGGGGRVLAVNVDAVAVVEPMAMGVDPGRIERFLEPVLWSGAAPVIVLTGAERFDRSVVAEVRAMVADRVGGLIPDVPVYPVSVRTGAGMHALRPLVAAGRTLGLIGRRGAGRSDLVDALVGARVLAPNTVLPGGGHLPGRVGDLGHHCAGDAGRRAGGGRRARHRGLVRVPGGGAVLDTPELSVAGVGVVTPEGLPGSA
jgi:ribosome biogenesis GTPase